jgi:hypothetical protein
MARFTINEADWNELLRFSAEARRTPVIALTVADGLAGNDFSAIAHRRVEAKWKEIGDRMGFDWTQVEPIDESGRVIQAPAIQTEGKTDDQNKN